jgi:aspartate/methionine/tyrosine aminotransferase
MATDQHAPWILDDRVRYIKPSATLAINEQVTAMRAAGQDIYHLGFGESRFPVHPKVIQSLRENADKHAYLPGQGLRDLRQAVAGYYNRQLGASIDPSQVIIAPGSKILLYALLLCIRGDVVLPCPSWVSYKPQAMLLNKRITWITTRVRENHRVQVARLQEAVARARREGVDPRILLLNSPHNPTGVVFQREQLQSVVSFCRAEGITIVSDEIYALIPHVEGTHLSAASLYPEGTVLTGGLSKHLSLGGWRLGVGVVPDSVDGDRLMNALISVASETWSAVSGPIQYAAVVAYGEDPEIEAYRRACTHLHALRTRYLRRQLVEAGVECGMPGGAFYLYPCFGPWRHELRRMGVYTSDQLAGLLLSTQQVATLPGSDFGAPPNDLCLRLATSYVDFEEGDAGGERLLQALADASNADSDAFVEAHCPRLVEAARRLVAAVQGW